MHQLSGKAFDSAIGRDEACRLLRVHQTLMQDASQCVDTPFDADKPLEQQFSFLVPTEDSLHGTESSFDARSSGAHSIVRSHPCALLLSAACHGLNQFSKVSPLSVGFPWAMFRLNIALLGAHVESGTRSRTADVAGCESKERCFKRQAIANLPVPVRVRHGQAR